MKVCRIQILQHNKFTLTNVQKTLPFSGKTKSFPFVLESVPESFLLSGEIAEISGKSNNLITAIAKAYNIDFRIPTMISADCNLVLLHYFSCLHIYFLRFNRTFVDKNLIEIIIISPNVETLLNIICKWTLDNLEFKPLLD